MHIDIDRLDALHSTEKQPIALVRHPLTLRQDASFGTICIPLDLRIRFNLAKQSATKSGVKILKDEIC